MKQDNLDNIIMILAIAVSLIILSPVYLYLWDGYKLDAGTMGIMEGLIASVITIVSIYVGNRTRFLMNEGNKKDKEEDEDKNKDG